MREKFASESAQWIFESLAAAIANESSKLKTIVERVDSEDENALDADAKQHLTKLLETEHGTFSHDAIAQLDQTLAGMIIDFGHEKRKASENPAAFLDEHGLE